VYWAGQYKARLRTHQFRGRRTDNEDDSSSNDSMDLFISPAIETNKVGNNSVQQSC
jgi:hypothetical protein